METKVLVASIDKLENQDLYDYYYEKMPVYRREKIDRYKFDNDKRLSLGAGILLMRAVEAEGFNFDDLKIALTEFGKPEITNLKNIRFSLSHSKSRVMCAISENEIGCDVELKKNADFSIVQRFFANSEIDYLKQECTKPEFLDDFFRIWTLKESYVKAKGMGFYIPFDSFAIDISSEKPYLDDIMLRDSCQFHEFDIEEEYKYSCCSICTYEEKIVPQIVEF